MLEIPREEVAGGSGWTIDESMPTSSNGERCRVPYSIRHCTLYRSPLALPSTDSGPT